MEVKVTSQGISHGEDVQGITCTLVHLQSFAGGGSRDASQVSWLNSSVYQDTLVGQCDDGRFSVFKVRDKGLVSKFVLDPNLRCVFWDNEEVSGGCQRLFAQTSQGNVILYTVTNDGVTETMHIPVLKLTKLLEATSQDLQGKFPLYLIGCDQSCIILSLGLTHLASVSVSISAEMQVGCVVSLPDTGSAWRHWNILGKDLTPIKQPLNICQIVNGAVIIFDPAAGLISIHRLVSGQLFFQINTKLLGIDTGSLIGWRMTYDLSVLMLMFDDYRVTRVCVEALHRHAPLSIILKDSPKPVDVLNQTYLNYVMCRYGDSRWKQEVVDEHNSIPFTVKKQKKQLSRHSRTTEDLSQASKSLDCCAGPDVGRFKYRSQRKINSFFKDNVHKQSLVVKVEGWSLSDMEVTADVATLILLNPLMSKKAICFVNFEEESVNLHNLTDKSSVALSNSSSCPHMIWVDQFLTFFSPHTHMLKDDLITGMMSYNGASTADSLCQANKWTRTAVPLNTLESSLQHRQLDTLAFFFKSKQGLFTTLVQQQRTSSMLAEVQQLEDVLRLVTATVTSSLTDPQAKLFAEKLLSLSMEFVYGLIEDAGKITHSRRGRSNAVEKELKESVELLLSHIPALRECLTSLQYRARMRGSGRNSANSNECRQSLDNVDASSEEINVEQFVKENKLSQLQALMMACNQPGSLHYRQIVSQLLSLVKAYLEQRNITACQNVLNNLGCDVPSILWSLAQLSAGRSLQQFITSQLMSASALSSDQRSIVQFMEQLFRAYPNSSFTESMKIRVDNVNSTWPDEDDALKQAMFATDVFLLSHCGELVGENKPSKASTFVDDGLYMSLLLGWMSDWSEESKKAVLVEAQILKNSDILSVYKSDPETVWKMLVSHNMLDQVQQVIQAAASDPNFVWPENLTHCLEAGGSHLQGEMLRALIRLKKLNLNSRLPPGYSTQSLLPTVGGPMVKPHPLAYAGSAHCNQAHTHFLSQCVKAGLQLPVWLYCTVHGIQTFDPPLVKECSWLPLFQALHSVPRNPSDKSLMLTASLLAAADLWSSSGSSITVETMLDKGHILAAMATLSYMSQDNLNLNPQTLERCLHQFPKLMTTLLPEGQGMRSNHSTTVYELLMGNVQFDIQRLFGWHSTHKFAGEDSAKAMPHFSEPNLVAAHAQNRKLSFFYYLKHGRPVYAFLCFLADEIDKRDAPLSQKRIQQACGVAVWIACQNFNMPHVSSACVIFLEFLGHDSILARVLINTGRLLLAHRHKNVSGGADARGEQLKTCVSEIVSELQASVRRPRHHGAKLVSSLEKAVQEEIRLEGFSSVSFEANQKWTLVVLLCRLLSLPLTTKFLQSCARSDNWLLFTWFAQLHQFPKHQLQNLLHSFRSPHLRDHLHYVLANAESRFFSPSLSSSSASSSQLASSSQNQRASLYTKIGVRRPSGTASSDDEEMKGKEKGIVLSSFSSRLKHAEFQESEMPESSAPDDVFRMLFYSQSMPCQWKSLLAAAVSLRNPLFAELAACCGCPAVASVCGWLLASLSPSVKQDVLAIHGQQVSRWGLEHLEVLIATTLNSGQEDSLVTAFTILQPKSPLLPFFCFVHECLKKGHYASSKTHIDQFKDAMALWDNSKQDVKACGELESVGNRLWWEKVVYSIVLHQLQHVNSLYQVQHLLHILDSHNMSLVFSFDVLDFTLLRKMMDILHANNVPDLDLPTLLTSDLKSTAFSTQCQVAIDYLVSSGKFLQAQALALVTSVGREGVTLSQLREEKHSLEACGVWTAKYVRAEFWEKSKQLLLQMKCSADVCSQFFQAELQGTSIEWEKALLCQHWLSAIEELEGDENGAVCNDIFRTMWRHRIAAKMSLEVVEPLDRVFDSSVLKKTKSLDLKSDLVAAFDPHPSVADIIDLSAQELEVLDMLMGGYLDEGLVRACARVAAVFGHYNQDLAILQTCIGLANDQLSIDAIEPAMRKLVAKTSSKRMSMASISLPRKYSVSSSDGLSLEEDARDVMSDCGDVMEKLYTHCIHGKQVCLRVYTCYRISQILGTEYKEVVMSSEFDSLRSLLRVDHHKKFFLARDFLATSGLSDDEVTGFLADSIVEVLKMVVKSDSDTGQGENVGNTGSGKWDGTEVFSQFVKLCENTSLLGDRILQAVGLLLSDDQPEISPRVLTIQTELIIMAHECYTIASDMEGISHALRAARVLNDCLAEAGEFSLMIRLLTGVGRYSEMLYIFHTLQQHHQFELVLRKGMDREDSLKVAILDYLKRYQPDDSEAYTMVALKFSMFRDIAAMLEACGHCMMKQLKEKAAENKESQEMLKKCLQYFQDAAESYVKDNSVRKAQRCVKQARLVSLQLQFLSSGLVIIHLSKEEVDNFVNTHSRFIEAMVVADAYEWRGNWSEAVYNNVVVDGDTRYLQELKLHVHITASLIEDVVNKYKHASVKPSGGLMSLKKLLVQCKDAQLQYRLCSELGLTDIVTSMLKGDTGSYLQDISVL